MNLPWFEKYEDRYNAELQSLIDLDIKVEVNEAEKQNGILILNLTIPKENKWSLAIDTDLSLIVEYPYSFPFFRPEVFCENLSLPRHQNPLSKNLCLLPRPSQFWDVSKTIGEYLKDQLPKTVLKGNITDQQTIALDENEQAEPKSEYYSNLCNLIIASEIPEDASAIPTNSKSDEIVGEGKFIFNGIDSNTQFAFDVPNDEKNILRFVIKEWQNSDGRVLSNLTSSLNYGSTTREGAWFKISDLGTLNNNFYELILAETKKRIKRPHAIKIKDGEITYITGITFPEETAKGKIGWGWLFIIYGTLFQKFKTLSGIKTVPNQFKLTVGITRIGKKDYMSRIPKLKGFEKNTISVVGLGSLGAPSAIEFAKNGIDQLKILDFDKVEPSSSVRWPLGFKYMGLYKPIALKLFINEHFPFTTVTPIIHRLGVAKTMNHSNRSEGNVLDELLQGTSIIYDASAEEGVNNLLSEQAKRQGVPYISIEARRGAWGGLIFKVIPGSGKGCWMCLQHAMANGDITPPPQDDSGGIQPRGCGDLTFTGTSFDLQNISLAGVRLVVSTLCNSEVQYGNLEWNLAILELVDETGRPMIPTWRTYNLKIHPNCPYCATTD